MPMQLRLQDIGLAYASIVNSQPRRNIFCQVVLTSVGYTPAPLINTATLDTQRHDGVDYVVVVLFQRLDGLLAGDVRLGHDELDVFVLNALRIDLFAIVLLLLLSVAGVAVASMVVTGVVVLDGLVGELLSSSSLGASVEVLNLCLTKHDVRVAVGGLVDLGVVNDEENLTMLVSSLLRFPPSERPSGQTG